VSRNFAVNLGHMRERLVPTRFQLVRNQPISRIDCIILPEGSISGIARRLQITVKGIAYLIPPVALFDLGGRRRRDGAGADDGQQCVLDSVVDPQTPEGNAARLSIIHPATTATVTWDLMLRA
jgi:hypothetical protein